MIVVIADDLTGAAELGGLALRYGLATEITTTVNATSTAELLIIADRVTPYRLLLEVMFSAKQKEAGYKHFRLIVQKNFPTKPQK